MGVKFFINNGCQPKFALHKAIDNVRTLYMESKLYYINFSSKNLRDSKKSLKLILIGLLKIKN